MTYYISVESPIGALLVTSNGAGLTGVCMTDHEHGPSVGPDWVEDAAAAPLPQAKRQLESYFDGGLREFDVPIEAQGTPFQKRVWEELRRIAYGTTVSYGYIAERIGNPKAVRAVGLANGRNPISIIVPCHRVIGASGKLVGYGGGLPRKEWLLAQEFANRRR